ncbi:hypothetical protein TIFTF001_028039 [Ficus carica]|uniref:Uncharacterized protein n=1 Tax=Ficus carica TaxID=3494 RepID=A0AA88DP52_FICCA|nr:hypothetical protein TIFTF001_028039 [Ficus carica]
MTISQMTSLVKALNAVVKVRVLVTMVVVRQRNAQAPTGKGLRTRPAMVERKMARSCHAWGVTSTGLGTKNRTRTPMATEITSGMGFAPLDSFGGGGGGDGGDGGDDEALVLEWGRRVRRGVGRGEKREEGMGDDRRVRMEWEVGNGGMDGWDLGMRRGRFGGYRRYPIDEGGYRR